MMIAKTYFNGDGHTKEEKTGRQEDYNTEWVDDKDGYEHEKAPEEKENSQQIR